MRTLLLLPLFAFVVVLASLPACSRRSESTPRESVKEFRFNNGTEPETLDPALMTGMPEFNIAIALFEGLVAYDPETLAPAPGIAERWEVSSDKRTFTFHLRAARWSNGDPVTADDFLYSWRRVLEPATAAQYAYQLWYIENAEAYTKGELADFAKVGLRAPDPHTLVVTLRNPTPYFPELFAFQTFLPVHKACVTAHGNRWTRAENIVSNGPFVLREWKPQDRIVLERNPLYWNAAAVRLDRIAVFPIENENTALTRYKAGELDWLDALPAAMIPELKKRPDYHKAPFFATYFYRFNCTKKPFNDARVRIAFDLALDKARICRYVLQGEYEPAAAFVPPMVPGYASPKGLDFDPKRAAQLLAEAGYPGGKDFPRVTLIYNTSKRHEEIAVVAKQMWAEALGVEVNLLNQEWGVYMKTMNNLDYEIIRSAWIGDYLDANTFLDMFVTNGGNNRTGWSNARYDRLIADAAKTADPAARRAMLVEAEDILINREMPIMPVYFLSNLSLRSPRVRGFWTNSRNIHPYVPIDLAAP